MIAYSPNNNILDNNSCGYTTKRRTNVFPTYMSCYWGQCMVITYDVSDMELLLLQGAKNLTVLIF